MTTHFIRPERPVTLNDGVATIEHKGSWKVALRRITRSKRLFFVKVEREGTHPRKASGELDELLEIVPMEAHESLRAAANLLQG